MFEGDLALVKTSRGRFRDILGPALPRLRAQVPRSVSLELMSLRLVQLMRFWACRQLRRTLNTSNLLPPRNFDSARNRMTTLRANTL